MLILESTSCRPIDFPEEELTLVTRLDQETHPWCEIFLFPLLLSPPMQITANTWSRYRGGERAAKIREIKNFN